MENRPVVFITGAAGGIGTATCLEFASRGYDVAMADLSADPLESLAKQVQNLGVNSLILPGDLSDFDYAESAVQKTVDHFGKIDVLVNNAAWRELITMRTISLESWEKTLKICVTAPAFLSRWVAADMEKRNKGVIINISSIQSQCAAGLSPAYVAAKGALDALTNEFAILWGPKGVRVLAVNPGVIDTEGSQDYESSDGENLTALQHKWSEDMIPLRRWAAGKEIATTVAMLASDDASYITGTTIVVDGGVKNQFSPYSIKKMMFPDDF
ncbi:MAG: SDR family oxidoreductase [Planctomycetaceae bacterium]|nr:SDR family oxidoreductase [Planctomycetaceae bacterium]